MSISPILRQVMVAGSTQLAAFSVGGAVTFPALLVAHFRSNDTTMQLDLHTRSWIGSIYGLAGIPAILMPILSQQIGRKRGYIISCLFIMMGWILSYTSRTATSILVSESFHGLGTNSLLPISFLSMSEMLAPKYRSISLQAFGIAQCLGMAICGILGRFVHFKIVSIVMFFPVVIAIAIALTWPESPAWYACKGKFSKCEEEFVKLRGRDDVSVKELNELIEAERQNLRRAVRGKTIGCTEVWKIISSRDFYMPSLHIFVLLNMMYWSGGDVILVYFIELVAKSSDNEDAVFYGAIVMYIIVFTGMILTNILIARYNIKNVLLSSTFGVILCLICASVITFLQKLSVLPKDSFLCTYCLLVCIAFNCLGLASLVFNVGSELMPVKHRSIGGALFITFNCILYASSLKLSPYLFVYIDLYGTFLLYIANAVLCAVFVWKYVPETKGRSLQEIEYFYMYGSFMDRKIRDDKNVVTPLC